MNAQTQLQYKIHEILSKKGFYRLSLSQLLNVLILLDMPEQRQAKLIQRNTIIGLLKLIQKNKLKLENYFLDQKYRSIPSDIQIFVSKIVWDVIDVSQASQEITIAKQEITEKAVYPFNPFNYMNYSPSMTYPQVPSPNTRINYPASYLPYPNHPMYYYPMFGRMPSQQSLEPEKIMSMQMSNNNGYLISQQPQNERMIQEKPQSTDKIEKNLNQQEEKTQRKIEVKQKKAEKSKIKQINKIIQQSQKVEEQIQKDIKYLSRRQRRQKEGQNKLKEKQQSRPKRKLRDKKQEPKDLVYNVEKNEIQQQNNSQEKPSIKNDSKPKKNLKLKKILDKILGSNGQNKQQAKLNNEEVLVPQQQSQLQRKKKKEEEQQKIKQLKRIEEQKLLKRQKGSIDFFEIIKDHRQNRLAQIYNDSDKGAKNAQKEVSLPELQLIYYNSISDFDYKTFPRQFSPEKNYQNSNSRSVSIQTDLNLITHRLKIKGKNCQNYEMIAQQSFSQQDSSDGDDINSQSRKEQKLHRQKQSNQQQFAQNEVEQKKPSPPLINYQPSLVKVEEAFNVEELIGAGEAHFQNIQLQHGMILIQPARASTIAPLLLACLCKGTVIDSPWISCLLCQEKYHCQCLNIQHETANFFECPRCKLRLIDPFIKPAKIIGQFFASDLDKNPFRTVFDLSEFCDFVPLKNTERLNELELRCIHLDYSNDQKTEISWPDQTIVKINGLQIAKFYSLLKTSTLRRRKDASIIITTSIHNFIDHDYEDYSKITLQIEARAISPQQILKKRILNNGTYLIGVYYTQREKVEDLYNKFTSQIQSCNSDFVQSLMQLSGGDDLSLQKQVFRIQDPYTGQVMKFPVRGTLCKHAQCFDLKTYLMLMSGLKVRAWRCPVCGQEAKKFILDHWIFQLIQRVTLVNAIPYEIVFMKEGNIILKVNKEKQDEIDETPPEVKTKKIKKNRVQIKRQVTQGDGIKFLKR